VGVLKSREAVLNALGGTADFPTLPEVVHELVGATRSDDASAHSLSRILERDPPICARILKLANSAFFGLRFRVESVRQAIVYLGFDTVKLVALATGALQSFEGRQPQAFDARGFWIHSFGAARAAQLLANTSPQHASPAVCFSGGLLHNLGRYALALRLGDAYQELVARALRENRRLHPLEAEHLHGITGGEAGAWLMEQWNFPPLLVAAVRYQYDPESYGGPRRPEVAFVAAASDLSRATGFGHGGDGVTLEVERIPAPLPGTSFALVFTKLWKNSYCLP